MSRRIGASVVAGLLAGAVFGVMMQMMMAPTPDGGQMPMIAMVGQIIGSPTIGAGWLYHLFNSAVIGAIFGWLLGNRAQSYASASGWGAVYGFAWWIIGGLTLMPILLGMPAFAPLMMPPMRMVAMGSLVGHLIYGVILGVAFAWLHRTVRHRQPLHA
jgi:F0F1-type ATP synthase assembly protein I